MKLHPINLIYLLLFVAPFAVIGMARLVCMAAGVEYIGEIRNFVATISVVAFPASAILIYAVEPWDRKRWK